MAKNDDDAYSYGVLDSLTDERLLDIQESVKTILRTRADKYEALLKQMKPKRVRRGKKTVAE